MLKTYVGLERVFHELELETADGGDELAKLAA